MTGAASTPPRRVPREGAVLALGDGDVRWRVGAYRLRVDRVRLDISRWDDGQWVWVEGPEVGEDGQASAPAQQWLIRCAAIPDSDALVLRHR